MKHPCKKPRGKHLRRAIGALRRLGATAVRVEVNGHYFLSWTFGQVRMCIGMALSDGGNAFQLAWARIRAEFRRHNLVVPA